MATALEKVVKRWKLDLSRLKSRGASIFGPGLLLLTERKREARDNINMAVSLLHLCSSPCCA